MKRIPENMKYDYALLVNRGVAVTSCFIGVLEVLVGVFALICGFILLGGFCENVECGGITRGSGIFIGFPILVPGLLGIVLLGTRHIKALYAFLLTNIIVCIFSIVHTIMTSHDTTDYWDVKKDLFRQGKCGLVNFNKCQCDGQDVTPYRCELITFGADTNWIIFGLAITSIVLTVFGIIAALYGRALRTVKVIQRTRPELAPANESHSTMMTNLKSMPHANASNVSDV